MGFKKIELQSKDRLPASLINAMQDAIIEGKKIQTGSYVGTGTYGSANPNKLTFGFTPKLVFIKTTDTPRIYSSLNTLDTVIIWFGATQMLLYGTNDASYYNNFSYTNNEMEWYNGKAADKQMNNINVKYQYIAIG